MSLKRSDVRAALEASLLDAASIFGEPASPARAAALDRHLDAACLDLSRVKPRIVAATLSLAAGTALYEAPADALRFQCAEAADINAERLPYEPDHVPVIPRGALSRSSGARFWRLSPVPDYRYLAAYGSAYSYTYFASYTLSETPALSTVPDELQPLLILRGQVEALRELAIRNAHKPVQMRDGLYSQTRNGTPAGVADLLMRLFEQQTRDSSQPYGAAA